jgi:hypothetical protein
MDISVDIRVRQKIFELKAVCNQSTCSMRLRDHAWDAVLPGTDVVEAKHWQGE